MPRILPDNLSAEIDLAIWQLPSIFQWIQEHGNVAQDEMLRTFNCGIGMVAIISPDQLAKITEEHIKVGKIVSGQGTNYINKESWNG